MKQILLFLILITVVFSVKSQTKNNSGKPVAAQKTEKKNKRIDEYEMKNYFMVFLKKGPNRNQDSITAAEIQKGHLEHLTKMANTGKMDLAGPFMDDWDVKGICVYNVNILKGIKELTAQDPGVKSGRLVAEIHPWYSAKGASLK